MARRWQVLMVTSIAAFMTLLDVTIVNIAFPDIRRSFPQDPLGDLSWILNAYNIVFAAALVPPGRLADRGVGVGFSSPESWCSSPRPWRARWPDPSEC